MTVSAVTSWPSCGGALAVRGSGLGVIMMGRKWSGTGRGEQKERELEGLTRGVGSVIEEGELVMY